MRKHLILETAPRTWRAFTLIELLCVIAVVAILGALILMATSRVRERAMLLESHSNLRQLHQLAMTYALDNGGLLPAGSIRNDSGDNGNFFTILRDMGVIEVENYRKSKGETILFNPLLVAVRKDEILGSTANSYAVNFWATQGDYRNGNLVRSGDVRGSLNSIEDTGGMALLMDGKWNGQTWNVQIGNWEKGSNLPDFSYPSSSVGNEDPEATAQVVFIDGHVESIALKDFPQDLNTTFWKGN